MTFAISIGKYGGFYWSRAYTTRLCLGWVAFTLYPFDFDGHHNQQRDRTTSLMDCCLGLFDERDAARKERDDLRKELAAMEA